MVLLIDFESILLHHFTAVVSNLAIDLGLFHVRKLSRYK
jgi:hypothetical protein